MNSTFHFIMLEQNSTAKLCNVNCIGKFHIAFFYKFPKFYSFCFSSCLQFSWLFLYFKGWKVPIFLHSWLILNKYELSSIHCSTYLKVELCLLCNWKCMQFSHYLNLSAKKKKGAICCCNNFNIFAMTILNMVD